MPTPSPDTGQTQYVDASGALAYKTFGHGIDGSLLLDPFLATGLQDYCPEQKVIDLGCGAAKWAIHAVEIGADRVDAIDNSPQMLSQAEAALADQPESVRRRVGLQLASVLDVPRLNGSFDTALSINVGCAIEDLDTHFKEMARILKLGGVGIITAPVSLEVPFTTFGDEERKIARFKAELDGVTDEAEMKTIATAHTDILRATIVPDGSGWYVPEEADNLELGQAIYRKIPGVVVPNFYHTEAEYEAALQEANLDLRQANKERLSQADYNDKTGLGLEYLTKNAFAFYIAQKPAV